MRRSNDSGQNTAIFVFEQTEDFAPQRYQTVIASIYYLHHPAEELVVQSTHNIFFSLRPSPQYFRAVIDFISVNLVHRYQIEAIGFVSDFSSPSYSATLTLYPWKQEY